MQSTIKIWVRQRTCPTGQQDAADPLILNSLCKRILSMPSSDVPDMRCSNDHMYEACRLTSILLISSVGHDRHWRFAAEGTSILQHIREALQKTDLEVLWDKNIGLLYYVALVFQGAAFGTPEYPFGHVLQGRIHFEVCCSYSDWYGALKPMAVLSDLMPVDHATLPGPLIEGLETMPGYNTTLTNMRSLVRSSFTIPLQDIESHG